MPYTLQHFQKDFVLNHLKTLLPEDVLNRYSPGDRLKDLSEDELLDGLPVEQLERLATLARACKSSTQ